MNKGLQDLSVAVIIPTYNRPKQLIACLESISSQSLIPQELIIIDDGELNRDFCDKIRNIFSSDLSVKITQSSKEPGTSAARNTGIALASTDLVLILDDDVVIGRRYIERVVDTYKKYGSEHLAGVGGFDSDLRSPSKIERLFNRIFLLDNDGWRVNSVGFQSWDPNIKTPTPAQWLSGNNASYRRELLEMQSFPVWEGGREPLEDIALGMDLNQRGFHFIINPNLDVNHKKEQSTESAIGFGMKRARNRRRIFHHYGDRSHWPLFIWCLIGDILRHVGAPFIDKRFAYHWSVFLGMVIGTIQPGLTK